MKHFAFCRVDGVVQFTSSVQDGLTPQVPTGLTLLPLDGPIPTDGPYQVVAGTLVPYVEVLTLAQHKINKWATVKAARDASVATPKTTSIGQFDADEVSQNNLNKVIALVQIAQVKGLPATANYTLATNVRVSLTLAQLQTAALEMGAQVQALYDKADALRTQINAATDIPTVEAIAWTP